MYNPLRGRELEAKERNSGHSPLLVEDGGRREPCPYHATGSVMSWARDTTEAPSTSFKAL